MLSEPSLPLVRVLLVTSEGCKPCTRVKRVLNELQAQMPDLSIEEVDYYSPAGTKLAMEKNITYPPAVFIEGALFEKGKIHTNEMVSAIRKVKGASN